MTDANKISDRLRKIVEDSGMTDQDFAATIGIDRSQFGRILRGKLNITLKQIMEISSHYNVRSGWIIEGEGLMYKNEKSGPGGPDQLLTLRKQISTALVSLQEAMKTLPQPLGPEIGAAGDPAFRRPGKTKRTEKQ